MTFPPQSRYYAVETATHAELAGNPIKYLKRRFLPQPERFVTLQEHTVVEGDRLDNLSARYLGDPEQAFRLADANRAMQPEELTSTLGRRLRITLPEGVPGAPLV